MTHTLQDNILETFFGLQDYFLTKHEKVGDTIFLHIHRSAKTQCGTCLTSITEGKYDSNKRRIYLGNFNTMPVYAILKQFRIHCPTCGCIRTEYQSISKGKSRYAKDIGDVVIKYTQNMSCSEASRLLKIPERTLREIDKTKLKELEPNHINNVPDLKIIGIDEVAHKRGHNYGTVMINYKDSKVVWVEKERKSESLEKIYKMFANSFPKLEVASMDFWRPFENATSKKHPQAVIVYDLFHLARILNRKVEEERRAYQKTLSDEDRKYIKKHTRWILLRRRCNYTEYHEKRLQELKEHNEKLYEMYLLKEEFLSIFKKGTKREDARIDITNWIAIVKQTDFEALKKFGSSILKRIEKILNWFDYPVSNGRSEGINNVIKTLLKRGYGYKDFEYFRLKVLQKCGYLMVSPKC
jgi:transposase